MNRAGPLKPFPESTALLPEESEAGSHSGDHLRPQLSPTFAAMPAFACDRCGACCRNLALHALYRQFDRGDGVCRHFDSASGLCAIYAERPLLCRVDASYDAGLIDGLTRSEYHAATRAACDALKARTATPQQKEETGHVPGAT